MNDFAVWVGGEHFVETACSNVKDDGNQDIALGLVVQPVHQDYKGYQAEREIEAVQNPRLGHVALVVALDEERRQMPKGPEDPKYQARAE